MTARVFNSNPTVELEIEKLKLMIRDIRAYAVASNVLVDNSETSGIVRQSTSDFDRQRHLADLIVAKVPVDELRMAIAEGAKVNEPVTQGLCPLHYAAYANNMAAVRLLLVRGCDVDATDECGYSAIHLCAEHGNADMMRLLLQYSPRVTFRDRRREAETDFPVAYQCEEPLRLAIKNNHFECARLLLENGADANAKYFYGPELAHVDSIDIPYLTLLLKYGAKPDSFSRDGTTQLMRACAKGEKGIPSVKLLLRHGANINAMGLARADNRTPLHYAVLSAHLPLVEYVLEHGAKVNMPDGYDRPSPLDIAVLRDSPTIVDLLLKYGADPNAVYTYIGSPLHLVASSALVHSAEIVKLLLDAGANANHVPQFDGGCALKPPLVEYFQSHSTTSENPAENIDTKVVLMLLQHGAQVVMRSPVVDPMGLLRLLATIYRLHPRIFKLLVDNGEHWDRSALNRCIADRDVRASIDQYTQQPPSLIQQSRAAIRRQLKVVTSDKVDQLPVPDELRSVIIGRLFARQPIIIKSLSAEE